MEVIMSEDWSLFVGIYSLYHSHLQKKVTVMIVIYLTDRI